jgi:hypothetical protein
MSGASAVIQSRYVAAEPPPYGKQNNLSFSALAYRVLVLRGIMSIGIR